MTARSLLPGLGLALALVAGCTTGEDEDNLPSTTFAGGRVLLAGPDVVLRNAALSVAQIKYLGPPPTVEINVYVDDTTTGPDGRFFIDGGQASGQYRLTFRGGEFTDPGTGQVVRLDQADELVTYMDVKIGSRIENHVVSPASVITARVAEQRFATGQDSQFEKSLAFARAHVDAYLGGVAWEFVQPADLTRPAPSPTEAVRAAWLLGAFDLLARDMATAANASPSEVNVHKLLQAWSTDLGAADRPTFDGNDADARGGGLRLGSECPAPDPVCVPPPGCATGACRPRCELYSGSARVSLAEAMYGYAKRTAAGHGLPDSDALAAARALQAVNDPLLFAPTACVEDLDRAGPSIVFELPDAAVTDVAGTLTVRARAMDMLDLTPGLTLSVDGATLPDDDGDPSDGLATATIDTQARSGMLKVTARAVDDAGNATTLDRMWLVDNAAPSLTVLVDGFLDDGAAWWIRPIAMPPNVPTGPRLTGTVDDAHLRDVRARVGGVDVATATVAGNAWELTLPDGTVPGVAPVTVELVARDHAGNQAMLTRTLRRDDTPPVLTMANTTVHDEAQDDVHLAKHQVGGVVDDIAVTHTHQGALVPLGPATPCDGSAPTIKKYAYLLDEARPPYVLEVDPDPMEDTANPVRWRFAVTDDGIGIDATSVSYRLRDATSGATILDWTAAPPVVGGYEPKVYRRATTVPSAAALGRDGRFEIELRARDRLGREVTAARCWNQELLAAPLVFDPADVATSGLPGSGKAALRDLGLGNAVSGAVSAYILNASSLGSGLMEYVVWNPTTEPVYLTIDLTVPSGGTYSKTYTKNRWTFSDVAANTACGTDLGPDVSLPGCDAAVTSPGPGDTTPYSAGPSTTTPLWSVRIWEELTSTTFAELTQCAGCSDMSPVAGQLRVTVLVPARPGPVLGQASAPRKLRVMPVVKAIDALRPECIGNCAEFTAGGVQLTGQLQEQRVGCTFQRVGTTWRCVSRRTYSRYRALTAASFAVAGNRVETFVRTSPDGVIPASPAYLPPGGGDTRQLPFFGWSSAEPTLPPSP